MAAERLERSHGNAPFPVVIIAFSPAHHTVSVAIMTRRLRPTRK